MWRFGAIYVTCYNITNLYLSVGNYQITIDTFKSSKVTEIFIRREEKIKKEETNEAF